MTTTVVETSDNKTILIRQIAGAMARRIVCYAKEDSNVLQGEELGFIKFGCLPKSLKRKEKFDDAILMYKKIN